MSEAGAPSEKPEKGQRSLFGEILDWMLAPLLLIWPISVALTWLVAQGIANKPYDRELGEMARTLGLQAATEPSPGDLPKGRSRYALAPEAAALLRADESDTIFYQVLGLRGEHRRIYDYHNFPPHTCEPRDGRHAYLRGTRA